MTLATILSLLLVIYLKKALKNSDPRPSWYQYLTPAIIGIIVLYLVQEAVHASPWYMLVWPAILFFIIYLLLKEPELSSSKNLVVAVLPLAIISALQAFLDVWNYDLTDTLRDYVGIAYPFAFVWAGAFFILFSKQQKALGAERKKREEEEVLNKVIAARKDELEEIVAERTSEIRKQKDELQQALDKLTDTQDLLIHSEKMASLGELTAGIAHEIQNPLNFVNNFSEVNAELIEELKHELHAGRTQEAIAIANSIPENEQKISHHGKRADSIVKGMLQHSRNSSGQKELTNINELLDECMRLSFHGLRAKDKSFNAKLEEDLDETIPPVNVVPQDIGRVLLNLLTNAFYSVMQRKKKQQDYDPVVSVKTRQTGAGVTITVTDNGLGIPQKVIDKIFQPFFTTKPSGEGTGLGLSMSYDIITKGHGGELKVESKENEHATFIIYLPYKS